MAESVEHGDGRYAGCRAAMVYHLHAGYFNATCRNCWARLDRVAGGNGARIDEADLQVPVVRDCREAAARCICKFANLHHCIHAMPMSSFSNISLAFQA